MTHSKNQQVAGCGFHHVAIRTANWERSLKFYGEGLGFVPKVEWGEAPRRAALLDLGDGNYLEVFEREPVAATPAAVPEAAAAAAPEAAILHFCLRTDDVDGAVEKARAAGAEVTLEPCRPEVFAERGMKVRIAFIKGPDGEVCEFFACDTL